MAKIIPSKFESVEFTPEEEIQARTFVGLNLLYLKQLRADAAEMKLALRLDPTKVNDFVQEEAAIVGRLELLNQLIGD